jgi:hypothetical protein
MSGGDGEKVVGDGGGGGNGGSASEGGGQQGEQTKSSNEGTSVAHLIVFKKMITYSDFFRLLIRGIEASLAAATFACYRAARKTL